MSLVARKAILEGRTEEKRLGIAVSDDLGSRIVYYVRANAPLRDTRFTQTVLYVIGAGGYLDNTRVSDSRLSLAPQNVDDFVVRTIETDFKKRMKAQGKDPSLWEQKKLHEQVLEQLRREEVPKEEPKETHTQVSSPAYPRLED